MPDRLHLLHERHHALAGDSGAEAFGLHLTESILEEQVLDDDDPTAEDAPDPCKWSGREEWRWRALAAMQGYFSDDD